MPRPPKTNSSPVPAQLLTWAEQVGEALGRGVARGINAGLSSVVVPGSAGPRRGRPPKSGFGPNAAGKLCTVAGCDRPARSKGLCSAHYQAERRRQQAKTARG